MPSAAPPPNLVVLNWGPLSYLQCPETVLLVTTGDEGCFWHLMGEEAREGPQHPTTASPLPIIPPTPATKNHLAQNISSAGAEYSWPTPVL